MTLRKKTLTIIGVTFVGLIVILYFISQNILLGSFAELEERSTHQNIERALSALSDDLSSLGVTTGDWASWDDTYAFIEDVNNEYIESNLIDGTFIELRLNLMMFTNSSGQTVFAKAFDLHNEEEIPIPQSLQEHLATNDLLLLHPDIESSIEGMVLLPEGPVLIASRPILTSEDEGPIRGALIMGRYLDATEINRLAGITHLSLATYRVDDIKMPPDFQEARLSLSQEAPIFIRPLDAQYVAGYSLLTDIYGKPALVLRADMTRDIYEQGQASITYLILSIVVVGLVFGAVTMLLLEKHVLSRLGRLSKSVSTIGTSSDLSMRVPMTGKDEVSRLADTINVMMEVLEQSGKVLQESEERYRDLFENANDLIQSVAPDGHFLYVNKTWREVLGYSEAEVANLTLWDIIHPDFIPHCREVFQKVMSGETVSNIEAIFVTKDGKLVTVEGNASCRSEGGKPVATRGIFRNITERKQAEEELQKTYQELKETHVQLLQTGKMAAMGEMAAGIAHELAQPLLGIKGFATAMLEDTKPYLPTGTSAVPDIPPEMEQSTEDIKVILQQTDRMMAIVNNIRQFARESGTEMVLLDINKPVKDALMLFSEQLRLHNITVKKNLSDLPQVIGNANQLQQVFINLITNARDAIDAKGKKGQLTISTGVCPGGVYVEAEDTGIGADAETISKMFEPFFTTKTDRKSIGLGLPIVTGIIEEHRGTINVRSEPGRGCKFTITLPLGTREEDD